MTDAIDHDPYAVVLADLRAKRAQIDQTIALLEALRGNSAVHSGEASAPPKSPSEATGPGAFLGMTITDAAKTLLATKRRQLTNAEIVQAFKDGGLILNSAEPLNTVGSVLNRRFIQVGDVVRVGRGVWGLKEWYPNRSFKPATKADAASSRPTDQILRDMGLEEAIDAPEPVGAGSVNLD